ncbi:MAG: acyclic terpene utilization AtuA family protein [Steroidobacteraceae bacterium]
MKQHIAIGGASGFWGDSFTAVPQLLRDGQLDYLVFDYLAEVTMSILARARAENPQLGYATDFVTEVMRQNLGEIARQRVKVISNAGGMNPLGCAEAIRKLIAATGLDLKVAAVVGDDLLDRAAEFGAAKEMFSGDALPAQPMSINAYCGAFPIAEALRRGADIVITGRVVDSAVVLGACIYEFDWAADDFDKLAGGSLAGHILECGAQGSGGLFTDWKEVPDWDNIAYPIAEVRPDATFIVRKPNGTGGLVSRGSVAEQLVYEIGDPGRYLLPDVTCDFTQVRMEEVGDNRVRVSGCKGYAPGGDLKVSATWSDGHRLTFMLSIVGIEADGKARKTAEAVFKRCARMFQERGLEPFTETHFEILGAEASYGANARPGPWREVVLMLAAKHPNPKALALLLREATSTGTSMSPGTTGIGGHRPKPMPQVRLFSFLLPKAQVIPRVLLEDATVDVPFESFAQPTPPRAGSEFPRAQETNDMVDVPLVRLAWGRSGDKGNKANIGILARKREYLPYIAATLTAVAVKRYFQHHVRGEVERFALPGLDGMNFLMHDALAGGGTASLRIDPLAKAYAQMLLDHPIRMPKSLLSN